VAAQHHEAVAVEGFGKGIVFGGGITHGRKEKQGSTNGDFICRYLGRMKIRVECDAGYRGEQEPVAFWLGQRRLGVRDIVDRWFAPTKRWFRVDADDDQLYVLRHDEAEGEWELAALTRSGSAPLS
jgi:hypothetical protein